jgi:hypothetical protein
MFVSIILHRLSVKGLIFDRLVWRKPGRALPQAAFPWFVFIGWIRQCKSYLAWIIGSSSGQNQPPDSGKGDFGALRGFRCLL